MCPKIKIAKGRHLELMLTSLTKPFFLLFFFMESDILVSFIMILLLKSNVNIRFEEKQQNLWNFLASTWAVKRVKNRTLYKLLHKESISKKVGMKERSRCWQGAIGLYEPKKGFILTKLGTEGSHTYLWRSTLLRQPQEQLRPSVAQNPFVWCWISPGHLFQVILGEKGFNTCETKNEKTECPGQLKWHLCLVALDI